MKRIDLIIISLFVAINSTLSAWWDAGHMAVAQIAYEELQPEVRQKVDQYIDEVSGPFPNYTNFAIAGLWADDIANDGIGTFFTWHGAAYPYNPEGVFSAYDTEMLITKLEATGAVWAIEECLKTLRDPEATPWAKGFMLRILIHIVGDIHQPSHCVMLYNDQFPKGDRAGTRFKVEHPKYKTLHNLFDAMFGLGDRVPGRPMSGEDKTYLDKLVFTLKEKFPRDSLDEFGDNNIDHWRRDSYNIGVKFGYAGISPGEAPSETYMKEGQRITERQVALAGYRLGDLLNGIFGNQPKY